MNLQTVPHLNPHFRLQWEPAQDCHVLLYPEGMIKLNGSAGEILVTCTDDRTVEQIIELLNAKFPGVDGLDNDVCEFLAVAEQQGWIKLD